jgi:serine/threonine-protein kinase/endoribonuclease IRE1
MIIVFLILIGTPGWIAPELLKGDEDTEGDLQNDSKPAPNTPSTQPLSYSQRLLQLPRQRGTKQVDLFSLGCVIYYLLTSGRHPYGETHYEREWRISRGEATGLTLEALKGDDCALQLVKRCLHVKPELRIGLQELLHHPYFWYVLN